jgi:hypothetical protein
MQTNIIWDFNGSIPMSDKTTLKTALIPTKSGAKEFVGFFKGYSFVVISGVKKVEITIVDNTITTPISVAEEVIEETLSEETSSQGFPEL